MNRLTSLATAVTLILSVVPSQPAVAQPRGRSQAGSASPSAVAAADDSDGPEARGVALFRLDDIIEVAVRLSADIARARVDRKAAQDDAGAAGKDQQWVLSATANYDRDSTGLDPSTDQALTPGQVLATDKITGGLSLGRNLPTGGNVSVELGLTHQRQEIYWTSELRTSQTGAQQGSSQQDQGSCGGTPNFYCQAQATARLSWKQPLLRGLGSGVALAPQRKADLAAAEATVKAQLAAEQLLRDIITAYWELSYAAYEVDVRTEALELARKQDQMTRQEMRAGTASQNSLDAVTYEIATRDEALLTAKLAFENKSLDLRRKAGLEIGRRDIVVRPGEPLELDDQDWNIDEVLAQSHRINRQLATVVLEKKIADVDVAVAHDAALPQIDLSLSGALLGTGSTASAALGGDGDANGNSGVGYQVTAGLTMSFELSGSAKAAHAAAVARRRRLDIDRVDLERQIDAEVVSSVKTLKSGRTRVALSDKAIAIAEDNVKAERANFLAGRTNNFQVMQRQTQLIEARMRRGRAVADYRVAVAQLQYLSGTLLDAYRVRVRSPGERE